MTKIKRRYKVVSLYHGNYQAELTALLDKAMAARRAEAAEDAEAAPSDPDEPSGPPRRAGQKAAPHKPVRDSIRYAIEYDRLLNEAEETAEKVTVWAIAHDDWDELYDAHPPRDDVPANEETGTPARTFPDDQQRGVNAKTFPPLLLRASLVDPEVECEDIEERIAIGGKILDDLDLSRIHFVKLQTAAWNVNVEGDEIPKDFSLVSFLAEGISDGSEPLSDSA